MNHDQDAVKETKETRSIFDGFKGSLLDPIITNVSDSEIDTIRKDWFKHVLLNIEKLYRIAEESRKENIISLQMLRDDIKEFTSKISNNVSNERKNKVLVKANTGLAMKAIVCGALAGFVGGITAVLISCIIEAVLFK